MYKIEETTNKIIQGHVLDILRQIPSETIDMVCTSPPYYGLRAYSTSPQIWDGDKNCQHEWIEYKENPKGGHGSKSANVGANRNDEANRRDKPTITNFCLKCGAWHGELGLEPTYQLYLEHLFQICDEIKRILKKTGTLWWNIGDSYASSGGASRHFGYSDPKYKNGRNGSFVEPTAFLKVLFLTKSSM